MKAYHELVQKFYDALKTNKAKNLDVEIYKMARKEVDTIVEERKSTFIETQRFSAEEGNRISTTTVTQLMLVATIAIGFVSSNLSEWKTLENKVTITVGLVMLCLSIFFGILELDRDVRFFRKSSDYNSDMLQKLLGYKYESFQEFDGDVESEKKKRRITQSTKRTLYYLQALFCIAGFFLVIFGFTTNLDLRQTVEAVLSFISDQLFLFMVAFIILVRVINSIKL
ncbi:hypothetical protein KC992_00865 [Candidatus Saccharibacteria bacterium]|nr:hypothetical protein [Candidatus Saccharibacteria bacterium]